MRASQQFQNLRGLSHVGSTLSLIREVQGTLEGTYGKYIHICIYVSSLQGGAGACAWLRLGVLGFGWTDEPETLAALKLLLPKLLMQRKFKTTELKESHQCLGEPCALSVLQNAPQNSSKYSPRSSLPHLRTRSPL